MSAYYDRSGHWLLRSWGPESDSFSPFSIPEVGTRVGCERAPFDFLEESKVKPRCGRSAWQKFSNVSAFLNSYGQFNQKLTYENFHHLPPRGPSAAIRGRAQKNAEARQHFPYGR